MCVTCAPAPRNAPTAHTDATLPIVKHNPNFAGATTSVGTPKTNANPYADADVALNAKNHTTRSEFIAPTACVVCVIVSDAARANVRVDVCAVADAWRARATPCVVSVSNRALASRVNDSQSNDDDADAEDAGGGAVDMTRARGWCDGS
jgi:hypothetical protein